MGGRDKILARELGRAILNTESFVNVDVVQLKPLPSHAKESTAQVDGNVFITTPEGIDVPEVAVGNVDLAESIGGFTIDSTGTIRLLFEKGAFGNIQEAMDAIADYEIVFQMSKGTQFIPNMFYVDFHDNVTGNKFFDSRQLTAEQMMQLVSVNIESANVNPMGMDNFHVILRPVVRT